MSVQILQQIAETRRSLYVLNKDLPISQDEIRNMVTHAVQHTPSACNAQTSRVVVLLGAEHEKLWDLTAAEWRKIIPSEQLEATENKMNTLKAAAGSILFFEDQILVRDLQNQFAAYASHFPVWAEHANAMLQYAIWTSLAAANIGANLQHYNPMMDKMVAKTWSLPETWQLRTQLVFGGIGAPAGEKAFIPVEERVKVFA